MFRFLMLCLLLAPPVMGRTLIGCGIKWFECRNNTAPLNCQTKSNDGWIRWSKWCDGARDCADGSDESLTVCKQYPNDFAELPGVFYCASGGRISDDTCCDDKFDCWDKSDELGCSDEENVTVTLALQGGCKATEIECLKGECIPKDKKCDGNIDCSNGRDESLELCYEICEEEFQCANGRCISKSKVCDKKIDCLDGADELDIVCAEQEGYITTAYHNCSIPKDNEYNLLSFHEQSVYHWSHNLAYVYPNEAARFHCPFFTRMRGKEWNVCLANGTWHHELPTCQMQRRNSKRLREKQT